MEDRKTEKAIRKIMLVEGCTREVAEKFHQISIELESPTYTKERGKELVKELVKLRSMCKKSR